MESTLHVAYKTAACCLYVLIVYWRH